MPRASEAIVQALKEAGITTIFGIPSIHNIGLYDAIRRDGYLAVLRRWRG